MLRLRSSAASVASSYDQHVRNVRVRIGGVSMLNKKLTVLTVLVGSSCRTPLWVGCIPPFNNVEAVHLES